ALHPVPTRRSSDLNLAVTPRRFVMALNALVQLYHVWQRCHWVVQQLVPESTLPWVFRSGSLRFYLKSLVCRSLKLATILKPKPTVTDWLRPPANCATSPTRC